MASELADGLGHLVVVQSFGIQPDSTEVMGVLEDVHRVERDVDCAVVVVVALLHARRAHTHHLETDAIDADVLRRTAAFPRTACRLASIAEHGNAPCCMLSSSLRKRPCSMSRFQMAPNRRIDAHHRKSERAVVVLNRGLSCLIMRDDVATRAGRLLRSSSMSSLVKRICTPALLPPAC